MAHKNPRQLKELIDALQDNNSFFFIHIDKKAEIELFNNLQSKNVFFAKRRVNVSWGGFSQILATLELIKSLIDYNLTFDYVHLLSGQDFPLKNKKAFIDYFENHKGDNFLEVFSLPCHWSGNNGIDRISYKWLIDEVGLKRATELVEIQAHRNMARTFPKGYQPYGGSQWWSLTNECIDYIAHESNPRNELYDFYKHTYIPDEMYFHTLIMNSKFKSTVINNNLRYIDWYNGPEYPKILRESDFYVFKETEAFFARKFDDSIDYQIRNRICREILKIEL